MATDPSHGNSAAIEEAKSAARQQWLKEIVTAVLGIGIVAYTLYMTYRAFGMVGNTTRMGNAKDLLTYLSGFAGVVVGYYFGRVPADARTAQAQQQIGQAVSEKDAMKGERDQAMSTMDDMKEKLTKLEDKMDDGQQLTAADLRGVRETA